MFTVLPVLCQVPQKLITWFPKINETENWTEQPKCWICSPGNKLEDICLLAPQSPSKPWLKWIDGIQACHALFTIKLNNQGFEKTNVLWLVNFPVHTQYWMYCSVLVGCCWSQPFFFFKIEGISAILFLWELYNLTQSIKYMNLMMTVTHLTPTEWATAYGRAT